MTIHPCYIGCDISKSHLDIFDPRTEKYFRIRNTASAIADMLPLFRGCPVVFVYEATGRYDRDLRDGLARAGMPGSRVNPAMARQFGRATGRRAKTDAIDARLLSDLGTRLTPDADPDLCPERQFLADLYGRRDQLVRLRTAEKNHLEKTVNSGIRRSVETVITLLTDQITEVEAQIDALIRTSKTMCRDAALLETAPGIGPVTRTALLALMPELGRLNPKQIASLAGLAPFNHDSGRMRGKRCIAGGRSRIRRVLYMAALSATRASPRYRAIYERICAKIPPGKWPSLPSQENCWSHSMP